MKNIKEKLKKIDKKIVFGGIGLIVLIATVILIVTFTPKTLKLTREEVLLDGFTTKETLTVKIKLKEIKSINLTKEINLSEYYDEYGTYYDSLEKVLNNGYSYLKSDFNLTRENYKMIVNVDTKDKGIVLNNLTIKYNGDDKTTLRYDVATDLKDQLSINVGDKMSKKELKEKLRKLGYQ